VFILTSTPTGPEPALFTAWPRLAERLAWHGLVARPTPVHRLDGLSAELGADIWIKRDDKTSPVYGGNKPRKLEFILADALTQKRKTLVTIGGLGTNHGLATTIFGRSLGFEVVLVLFEQPMTKNVRRNLLLFQEHGARLIFAGSLAGGVWRYYIRERMRRPGAYYVPGGGSSPVGTLGYVDAALEFGGQVQAGQAPRPEAVFVAAGSGGTLAGLSLGFSLAGLETGLTGVQVTPAVAVNPQGLSRLQRRALALMADHDPGFLGKNPESPPLIRDQYGPGYGHATEAARQAQVLLQETEGIELDLTYTAKAMAGLIDYVRQKRPAGPVLYWHTYNSAKLAPPAVSPRELPPEFHFLFDEPGSA
jgi:D-cysteine desulfhydrase